VTDDHSLTDSQPDESSADTVTPLSVECLESSFLLLRDIRPSLALTVQNLIAESRHYSEPHPRDKLITLNLDAQIVSDIVTTISLVAEQAASDDDCDKEHMIAIHQTLLDWLLYAQCFVGDVAPLKRND